MEGIEVTPQTAGVYAKLGSIVVHTEEFLSTDGHEFDKDALEGLLEDSDVQAFVELLQEKALVPVKRA